MTKVKRHTTQKCTCCHANIYVRERGVSLPVFAWSVNFLCSSNCSSHSSKSSGSSSFSLAASILCPAVLCSCVNFAFITGSTSAIHSRLLRVEYFPCSSLPILSRYWCLSYSSSGPSVCHRPGFCFRDIRSFSFVDRNNVDSPRYQKNKQMHSAWFGVGRSVERYPSSHHLNKR